MRISLVINVDTRAERNNENGMFNGVVDRDFLDAGVFNKQKFLSGFDFETIVYIDRHEDVPQQTLDYLYRSCDIVCVSKNHPEYNKFNDINYTNALSLASGDVIIHFDGDMAAFTANKEAVEEMISLLDKYDFISYPSHWTPNAVHDMNYDYQWCSTRFFMCKRENLDITEIRKCLADSDYLYGTYPASVRNPWTEHCIGLISKYAGKGVYYPPIDLNKIAIFCWGSYSKYITMRLNEQSYDEVKNFINSKGGIQYPVDIFV